MRGRAPLRRRGRARRRAVGPRDRSAAAARRAARASRRAARRGRARRDVDRRRERHRAARRAAATPTRCCSSTRSRRSAASRSRSTRGGSTPSTRARRSASACRPASSPVSFSDARGRARARPRATRRSRGTSTSASSPTTSAARAATTTPRRSRCSTRCTRGSACCSTKGSKRRGRGTRSVGAQLQAALPELGFRLFAEERRLPQLTSVWLPDGVDDAKVRGELLRRFDIEVGGGLGDARRQGLAHRPHGPRRPRALGRRPPRRPRRAPLDSNWRELRHHRGELTPVRVLRGGMRRLLAVEAELLDRLADVVEGAVVLGLARPLAVDRRVPAPAQLLERRHVDAAVVQVSSSSVM